jgi:WD40 repeat protein
MILEAIALYRWLCGHGNIHDIAICVQKSIILTAGLDRTVCCWDFAKGEQRFCRYFTETPIALSFHPSGLHAIISFPDEVRCVHVLNDDLRTFLQIRSQRKMSQTCVFSNGGHKFAISHDNLIRIYDFYTGELSKEFKGHNYKVTQVQWKLGDGEIISIDEDGIIYRWDLLSGKAVSECTRYKATPDLWCEISDQETLWILSEQSIEILSPIKFEVKHVIQKEKDGTSNGISTKIVSNDDSSIILLGVKSIMKNHNDSIQMCRIPLSDFFEVSNDYSFVTMEMFGNIVFLADKSNALHVMELIDSTMSDTLITQDQSSFIDSNAWCHHCLVGEIYLEEKDAITHDLDSLSLELRSNPSLNNNDNSFCLFSFM